jgi:hypothetical protein
MASNPPADATVARPAKQQSSTITIERAGQCRTARRISSYGSA